MRRFLMCLFICLVLTSTAFAGEAERTYQADGHFYVINFVYDPMYAFVPAVIGNAQAHYDAKISVYEVVNGEKQLIASFGGQYTENGCFEDDPKSLVEYARKKAGMK